MASEIGLPSPPVVQTGPLREGTVTLLTAVDDVQRWSPVLLSAWLTPPSFTLGSRESVHIPVGAVADDGGFQNYLEPATSFQIQSRNGIWHFRVDEKDYAPWLSVFQALARARTSALSKSVNATYKVLPREASVHLSTDPAGTSWTIRWLILKELRLTVYERAGSSVVTSSYDLSYVCKGYVTPCDVLDTPSEWCLTLLLPRKCVLPTPVDGEEEAHSAAAAAAAGATDAGTVPLHLAFSNDHTLSAWANWLVGVESLLFGYPLDGEEKGGLGTSGRVTIPGAARRKPGSRTSVGFGSGPSGSLRRKTLVPSCSSPPSSPFSPSDGVSMSSTPPGTSPNHSPRVFTSAAAKMMAASKRVAPKTLKLHNDAAVKIQKIFRGIVGRRTFRKLKAEKLKKEQQLRRAREFSERTKGVAAVKARIQREIEEQKERERAFEESKRVIDLEAGAARKSVRSRKMIEISAKASDAAPSAVASEVEPVVSDPQHHHRGSSSNVYVDETLPPCTGGTIVDVESGSPPPPPSSTVTTLEDVAPVLSAAASPSSDHTRQDAASLIQIIWRRWNARRHSARLHLEMSVIVAEEDGLKREAAVQIQCCYRVHLARRALELARKAKHDAILARVKARALSPVASVAPAPAVVSRPPSAAPPEEQSCCCVIS